jgi:PAS fold
MEKVMSHVNGDIRQQISHLFSVPDDIAGEAAAEGGAFATMVLDSSGTVRYCHDCAARLFRADAHALVGRHVRELIPDLPFKPATPEYNVAYATFWARESPQRGFCGVDSQGCLFGLQVALDRLDLERHPRIIVALAATG